MARTTPAQRTLASYRTEVRRLLHDATQKFWTNAELNDYINDARNRVCADTGCLRRLVSGYLVQERESYAVGSILGANLLTGGSGYTNAQVVFTGGDPTVEAVATATVVGGVVTEIVFSEYGEGYLEAPTIDILDGLGAVIALNITDVGLGYQTQPTLNFSGGGGSGAAGDVSLSLRAASFYTFGAGYTVGEELTLVGGTFTTPAKLINLQSGAAQYFAVSDPGDYTVLPGTPASVGGINATENIAVTSSTGVGAAVTAYWGLGATTITNPGTGYTSAPGVSVVGGSASPGGGAVQAFVEPIGPGSGATAEVRVLPARTMDVINITPIWGNQRIPMRNMPFTEFNARMRTFFINPQRPVVFCRYGSSHLTVMVQPIPDQLYDTEFDTAILPLELVADEDVDDISYPYTAAVAYYAAWKAKLKQQAYAEAEAYLKDYRAKVMEAQAAISMRRVPNPFYGYSGA